VLNKVLECIIPEAKCFSPVSLALPWALPKVHWALPSVFAMGFTTLHWPWAVFQKLLDFLRGHALFRVVLALVVWRMGPRQSKCQASAGVRGRPESSADESQSIGINLI